VCETACDLAQSFTFDKKAKIKSQAVHFQIYICKHPVVKTRYISQVMDITKV